MDRKRFIKQASLITIGGYLMPASLLSSCREDTLFEEINYGGSVIIIGAGAAGLYAGYLLKSKGIDFTLLEAAAAYGGRLGKLTGFADYTIDTGAQWMHGKNSIVGDLVKSHGITITSDESELSFWFKQQIVSNLPKDPFIFENDNLPDISFKEYAHQQGFGPEYDDIIEAIAGDQGASASALSAYWNSKDEENWVSGSEDFKFQESYFDAIDTCIAQEVKSNIITNAQVISVDYQQQRILLTDQANRTYQADKVIVTVPISILKRNDISFIPPLPDEKITAFSKFGMGPGMKIFLKFSEKFYRDTLYGGKVCGAYIDDSVGKRTADHILLAFVMGEQAAKLHALGSEAAITQAILQELDALYGGKATTTFIASSIHDYTEKPFIRGAYGYSTVGMGNARQIAALPVSNKLFFAGEAMNINGHHQTVQGAVESGYKAVIDILKSVQK